MDEFGLILAVIIFVVSFIANGVKKMSGAAQPPEPHRMPARLPDGSFLMPDGRVLPPTAVPAEWHALAAAGSVEESSSEQAGVEANSLEDSIRGDDPGVEVGLPDWERGARPRVQPARGQLETTEIDWNAEHVRFHKKYVDAKEAAPPATHGALEHLRGRQALRRAILTAEVLGPPRALRPME